MIGKRIIKFIIFVGIITGIFWIIWSTCTFVNTNEREEIEIFFHNDLNNGTVYARINYNIDFTKKLTHQEIIQNGENINDCPFSIELFLYNNVTFWVNNWLPKHLYLDTKSEPINANGVNFTNTGRFFEIIWYKNIISQNRFRFTLYISNAIKHPNTEIYSLSLESFITSFNDTQLNNTVNVDQSVWLDNYTEKGMQISETNVNFHSINNFQKVSSDFYHQWEYPQTNEINLHTRFDLDFTTKNSRRRIFATDIFFDLGITFPISAIVTYLVLDRVISNLDVQDKALEDSLDKISKQNNGLKKELNEIKHLLSKKDNK